MPSRDDIVTLFRKHGQEQVFAGWKTLDARQREELLDDCARVDFSWLEARRAEMRNPPAAAENEAIESVQVIGLPGTPEERARNAAMDRIGRDRLARGKVAAFVVAGGQGSRLGYDGPKGTFPIGPVSNRSLFQWHAEQILARGRRHGAAIPWYIMTSEENDGATRDFFEAKDFFGLRREDIFFFRQGMVPSLGLDGKLFLSGPSRLARNPDGHGGSLSGLATSGALADMRRRGVEIISYFQVDNPLVTIADPVFIGWHADSGSEMSSKVLEKTGPDERIGSVCLRGGRPAVIEYIDMDPERARARDAAGRLVFRTGSIAIHLIDVAFVERMGGAGGLPWHASRKKVPCFNGEKTVKPEKENACKFETFVFDAIPLADRSLNLEVSREEEFAPVKNAAGIDSAASCRQLLSRRFCRWLTACGIAIPRAGAGKGEPSVEISPLYSLDAEELQEKIFPGGLRLEKSLLLE